MFVPRPQGPNELRTARAMKISPQVRTDLTATLKRLTGVRLCRIIILPEGQVTATVGSVMVDGLTIAQHFADDPDFVEKLARQLADKARDKLKQRGKLG